MSVPIIGEENMIQELPVEYKKVLEEKTWKYHKSKQNEHFDHEEVRGTANSGERYK